MTFSDHLEANAMYTDYLQTPIGTLKIIASETGVTRIDFLKSKSSSQSVSSNKITKQCKRELEAYFKGKRKSFDFPLDQQGTDFQKSVWASLLKIPYGEVASYQDIANMIDNPKATRAVGAANGKNPLSIVVPCHRIIGSNGTLTGYASGLDRKSWLLKHEGVDL